MTQYLPFERQSQILTHTPKNLTASSILEPSNIKGQVVYSKKFSQTDELRLTLQGLKQGNNSVRNILQEWPQVVQNAKILTGLQILKEKQLLQDKTINFNNFQGKNRLKFIYNDYHQKSTNPGYSRNNLGGLFTR